MTVNGSGEIRQHLLFSLCNKAVDPQPTCLWRMNVMTHQSAPVDVGLAQSRVVSGVGLCADDSRIYHLSMIEDLSTWLSILDRTTLAVIAVHALPEIRDPHSIAVRDGEILIASSGTDEVMSYQLVGSRATQPRTYWSPTGAGTDTHHVNSVAVVDGAVWCSAFGVGDPETSWRTASEGYIYNIDGDVMVRQGLAQPHTVMTHDGELLFCNSRLGTVESSDGVVAHLAGYSRGLAVGNTTIYAGASYARRSRTAGDVFLNPGDQGALRSRCAIVHVPLADDIRVEVGMTGISYEIYDLLLL